MAQNRAKKVLIILEDGEITDVDYLPGGWDYYVYRTDGGVFPTVEIKKNDDRWTCPACGTANAHSEKGEAPDPPDQTCSGCSCAFNIKHADTEKKPEVEAMWEEPVKTAAMTITVKSYLRDQPGVPPRVRVRI